jgi:hypothetical protein
MSWLRKIAIVGVLGASLGVAGCQYLPWTEEQINEKIVAVQALCKEACSFLPTAKTVSAIISAGNPLVDTIYEVAEAICDQVTKAQALNPALKSLGKAAGNCPFGEVAGVCIEGDVVKKE